MYSSASSDNKPVARYGIHVNVIFSTSLWVSRYKLKECTETTTSSECKRTIAVEDIKVKKPPKGWEKKAVTIGEDGARALSITDDVAGAPELGKKRKGVDASAKALQVKSLTDGQLKRIAAMVPAMRSMGHQNKIKDFI